MKPKKEDTPKRGRGRPPKREHEQGGAGEDEKLGLKPRRARITDSIGRLQDAERMAELERRIASMEGQVASPGDSEGLKCLTKQVETCEARNKALLDIIRKRK